MRREQCRQLTSKSIGNTVFEHGVGTFPNDPTICRVFVKFTRKILLLTIYIYININIHEIVSFPLKTSHREIEIQRNVLL